MRCFVLLGALAGALAVAGCVSSYAPTVQGADAAPGYQKDLAACQEESTAALDKRNAKTGLAWFASPVRNPFQVRPMIRSCLRGKGYTVQGT